MILFEKNKYDFLENFKRKLISPILTRFLENGISVIIGIS